MIRVVLGIVSLIPAQDTGADSRKSDLPAKIVRLGPALRADIEKKIVSLDAEVVLREGPLELFLCPRRSKEHESVLAASVVPKAFQAALLLVGAKPGKPADFDPYRPPEGQKLKITVEYLEGGKPKSIDARSWIRDVKTGKELAADFVFTGSRFARIPGAERAVFLGDDGDLVCVSNFPGSVIDIALKSSKDNAELLFEAWKDRIPERGTKVTVHFEPMAAK